MDAMLVKKYLDKNSIPMFLSTSDDGVEFIL